MSAREKRHPVELACSLQRPASAVRLHAVARVQCLPLLLRRWCSQMKPCQEAGPRQWQRRPQSARGPRLPPGCSGASTSEFDDDMVICLLSDSVPCTCSKKGRVDTARQSLHLLLMRACSQMLDPPQSLHWLLRRWHSQSLRCIAPAYASPSRGAMHDIACRPSRVGVGMLSVEDRFYDWPGP